MKKLLLIGLLLSSRTCLAQSPYTVTGTVQSSVGTLATSGTVKFTIKPTSQSILYFVSGTSIIAPQASTCGINPFGLIKNAVNLANPCTVWGNDVITPGNTTYTIQFAPNGTVTNTINNLTINSLCTNLNTPCFVNPTQVVPQYQTITTSPIFVNLVPAADNVYNVGQAGLRYAAGYFYNVFATNGFSFTNLSLPGNLTVGGTSSLTGLVTLGAGLTGVGSTGTLTAGSGILANVNPWTTLQTFAAGITGTGNLGTLTAGTGILAVDNVWTHTQDFSGTTLFKARVGAGLTGSVNGDIGYDSTAKNWHVFNNGADAVMTVWQAPPADGKCVQSLVTGGSYQLATIDVQCTDRVMLTTAYTNGTMTPSNITGLSFPVLAGSLSNHPPYTIECELYWQGSAATAGLDVTVTGPGSPTTLFYSYTETPTVTTTQTGVASTYTTTIVGNATVTATTNLYARVTIALRNGTSAGTVQLQGSATGAGTVTVQAGSFCVMQGSE